MSKELTTFNFEITSLQQAMDYAKLIADSDLVPKDYKGKPGNVLIAIQFGIEIGLKPLQAVQNISVINGRPCIWGDAMIALVQNSPLCEYIFEERKGDTAYCRVKRRGEEEHIAKFSIEDAKKANLWSKGGTWSQYPDRMLQLRARAFALRDKFSDVLKGMAMREEVEDYQVTDISSKQNRITIAQNNVQRLIQSKSKNIKFEELYNKMDSSTTLEELNESSKLVKNFSEEEKITFRDLYKQKKLEIEGIIDVNVETGEITEDKPKVNTEFDKVKKQLLSAKSRDTLDVAADLISSCDDLEQKLELSDIYNKRKDEVK